MLKYCLAHEQKHFILTEGAWIESLRHSDRTGFNQLIRLLQSMSGWCPPSSCNKESHEHWPATNTSFPVVLWNRVRVFGTQAFADATHVGRSSSEIAQMLHFWDTCDAFCSEMLTGSQGSWQYCRSLRCDFSSSTRPCSSHNGMWMNSCTSCWHMMFQYVSMWCMR